VTGLMAQAERVARVERDLRAPFGAIAAVAAALVVFKLALSDGGRDAGALVLAQAAGSVLLAALVILRMVRPSPLPAALLAMTGVVAGSALWSVRPEATVREFLLWVLYLGLAVVAGSVPSAPRQARRIVDAVVFTAGWLCLVGLFMFWGANNPGMRWYSTFYWPNPFAGFLLLTLPVEMARGVRAAGRREATGHGALAVLLGTALVLTYSRGAWLSLALSTPLLMAVLRPPRWPQALARLLAVVALVAAAVALLTLVAVPGPRQGGMGVASRAASIADAGDLSIRGRLEFWRAALRIFRDHPWLGTGAGTFGAVHAAYQQDARFYARDAHNLYLQTLAELGWPGGGALAAVLVALVVIARRARRAVRGEAEDEALVAGCIAGLAAFFLHSAMEMNWAFPANPAAAFTLAGILSWYAHPAGSWTRRRHPVLTPAAVLLLAVLAVASVAGYAARQAYAAGQRKARERDWRAAGAEFARAARLDPIHPAYAAMQAAAVMQGPEPDLARARASLERAMRLDRMNATYPLQLARYLAMDPQRPGALREAERFARAAIALDPQNRPEAYRLLAQVFLLQGDIARAEEVYAEGSTRYSHRGLASGMSSVLLWPEAAALFQERAALLAAVGRGGEAAGVLTALLAEDPSWAPAYVDLARVYARLGRRDEADRVLRDGLRRAVDDERLWPVWRALHTAPGRPVER